MSTSSPEARRKSSSPSLSRTNPKSSKLSKIVKLKLSSYLLTDFPHEYSEIKPAKSKPKASETPKHPKTTSEAKDDKSNAITTPATGTNEDGEAVQAKDSKRKGVPGPKPGSKRSAPAGESDGTPKPKGKPGPKKRKLEAENGAPAPPPAPKLGPKANQGAINAQLRALDRTGKPCRRWGKRTVNLKSFTGVHWDLPYWQTPKLRRHDLSNDAESQDTSSSDAKNEPSSSQVASESNAGNSASVAAHDTLDVNGTTSFLENSRAALSDNVDGSQHTPPLHVDGVAHG